MKEEIIGYIKGPDRAGYIGRVVKFKLGSEFVGFTGDVRRDVANRAKTNKRKRRCKVRIKSMKFACTKINGYSFGVHPNDGIAEQNKTLAYMTLPSLNALSTELSKLGCRVVLFDGTRGFST